MLTLMRGAHEESTNYGAKQLGKNKNSSLDGSNLQSKNRGEPRFKASRPGQHIKVKIHRHHGTDTAQERATTRCEITVTFPLTQKNRPTESKTHHFEACGSNGHDGVQVTARSVGEGIVNRRIAEAPDEGNTSERVAADGLVERGVARVRTVVVHGTHTHKDEEHHACSQYVSANTFLRTQESGRNGRKRKSNATLAPQRTQELGHEGTNRVHVLNLVNDAHFASVLLFREETMFAVQQFSWYHHNSTPVQQQHTGQGKKEVVCSGVLPFG